MPGFSQVRLAGHQARVVPNLATDRPGVAAPVCHADPAPIGSGLAPPPTWPRRPSPGEPDRDHVRPALVLPPLPAPGIRLSVGGHRGRLRHRARTRGVLPHARPPRRPHGHAAGVHGDLERDLRRDLRLRPPLLRLRLPNLLPPPPGRALVGRLRGGIPGVPHAGSGGHRGRGRQHTRRDLRHQLRRGGARHDRRHRLPGVPRVGDHRALLRGVVVRALRRVRPLLHPLFRLVRGRDLAEVRRRPGGGGLVPCRRTLRPPTTSRPFPACSS